MIYICTVHHRSTMWFDIQLNYLRKNLKSAHTILIKVPYQSDVSVLEEFSQPDSKVIPVHFDTERRQPSIDHSIALARLYKTVCEIGENADIVCGFDSDAFPVGDLDSFIQQIMAKQGIAAMPRWVNSNNIHPAFSLMSVLTYKLLGVGWGGGKYFRDTGGKLAEKLLEKKIDWYRLKRDNADKDDASKLRAFGVYESLIYHHMAGSHIVPRQGSRRLRDAVLELIKTDDKFYLKLEDMKTSIK